MSPRISQEFLGIAKCFCQQISRRETPAQPLKHRGVIVEQANNKGNRLFQRPKLPPTANGSYGTLVLETLVLETSVLRFTLGTKPPSSATDVTPSLCITRPRW